METNDQEGFSLFGTFILHIDLVTWVGQVSYLAASSVQFYLKEEHLKK